MYGQRFNNELGLSVGSLVLHEGVNSVFYSSSKEYSFLPKVYFTKRIKNRWKMRINFEHTRYKIKKRENDLIPIPDYFSYPYAYNIPYPVAPNNELIFVMMKEKISEISAGPQFDFIKKKRVNIYCAMEGIYRYSSCSSFYKFRNSTTNSIHGYRYNDGLNYYYPRQQQGELYSRNSGIHYSFHFGSQYLFSKSLSANYEIGVHSYIGVTPPRYPFLE